MATRKKHGMECYCDSCADTAEDWYVWADEHDDAINGARYWTREHAEASRPSGPGPFILRHDTDDPLCSVCRRTHGREIIHACE